MLQCPSPLQRKWSSAAAPVEKAVNAQDVSRTRRTHLPAAATHQASLAARTARAASLVNNMCQSRLVLLRSSSSSSSLLQRCPSHPKGSNPATSWTPTTRPSCLQQHTCPRMWDAPLVSCSSSLWSAVTAAASALQASASARRTAAVAVLSANAATTATQ